MKSCVLPAEIVPKDVSLLWSFVLLDLPAGAGLAGLPDGRVEKNRYPNKEQGVSNDEVNIHFENRISLIGVHYSRSSLGAAQFKLGYYKAFVRQSTD